MRRVGRASAPSHSEGDETDDSAPHLDIDEVGRRLHERGLRLSRLKLAVLGELARDDLPLTAEEIAVRIGGETDPSPLYRCLSSLEEGGIAVRFYLSDGSRRWALSQALGGHHDYFICADCSTIERLADCALGDAAEQAAAARGASLLDHQVILRGICPSCRPHDDPPATDPPATDPQLDRGPLPHPKAQSDAPRPGAAS